MPSFRYTAMGSDGKRVAGVVAGASEAAVVGELESRSLIPITVDAERERRSITRRFSSRTLALTYTQLGDLLHAGVPILRALQLLARRRSNKRLASVMRRVSDRVADGEPLGDSMAAEDGAFPDVHVAMVRAGERGGFLEDVLKKLGEFAERDADLRAKLAGNMTYPCVIAVVGTILVGVIFGVFVPMFRKLIERQPSRPWITDAMLTISDLLTRHAYLTLVILVTLVVAAIWLRRLQTVRTALARAALRAPVLGRLNRSVAAARFCRMLGTMIGNGIPILSALQIAKDAAGNPIFADAIEAASEQVRSGQSLAGPLAESGLFEEDVTEMISVAEAAGNLDSVLVSIAQTVENQVDRLLTSAVKLVEPLLLVGIALCVVFVAAGLLLPMAQMSSGL